MEYRSIRSHTAISRWILLTWYLMKFKRHRCYFYALIILTGIILTCMSRGLPSLDNMSILPEEDQEHQRMRVQTGQLCILPQLESNHSSVVKFLHTVAPLECGNEENWVYVDNGTFRVSESAKKEHGEILCEYVPFHHGRDDYHTIDGTHIKSMRTGAPLHSDFFKAACIAQDQWRYFNVHSAIAYNDFTQSRAQHTPLPPDAPGLDVLIFGYDSVSRMSWLRNLPKSHHYFKNTLKGILLEGYNVLGDATVKNLLPILTGKTEEELPEARRGKPGAETVDNYPWIWKYFKKIGYVTQWVEDMAYVGTFTYRMLGFKDPPVDHYMRHFYLVAEKIYNHFRPFCLGSVTRHANLLNWIKDMYHMYGNKPKFIFGFLNEYSHETNNNLQLADDELLKFLRFLNDNGHLDKTVLILLSDHGARFGDIRETLQGNLEQRMPYVSFRFPPSFGRKYPDAMKNIHINAFRLTTPFDIHETLRDLISFKASGGVGDKQNRGISLFNEIPKYRSCVHAHIKPHLCACLTWQDGDPNDDVANSAVLSVVDIINGLNEPVKDLCEYLTLLNTTRVLKSPNNELLRFKPITDHDGRAADLSDHMIASETLYQVTFRTYPGYGYFEATVKHDKNTNYFSANRNEITRINKYGNDPICITNDFPQLRAFCLCRKT